MTDMANLQHSAFGIQHSAAAQPQGTASPWPLTPTLSPSTGQGGKKRMRRDAAEEGSGGTKRRHILRRLAIVAIAVPVAAVLLFRAAVVLFPYPADLANVPPAGTWIEDCNHHPLAAFVASDGQWRLPLVWEDLNPHLRDAIVAVEDHRFYKHRGVDWRSAAAALWQDVRRLRLGRGASTLSMQLHRLRDPAPRTFFNKLEQAVRACQIEQSLDKRQILAEYLNRAPFGGNLVGAGAASWRYFGRPCRQLSLGQCALLAGLPQNPCGYRPDRFPQRAAARRNHVLDRMLACGKITGQEHDEAAAEPVDAAWLLLPQDRGSGVGGRELGGMDGGSSLTEGPLLLASPDTRGEDQGGGQTSLGSGPWPLVPLPPAHATSHSSITSHNNPLLPALVCLAQKYPGRSIVSTLDSAIEDQTATAACEHLQTLASSGISAVCVVVLDTPTSQVLASISLSPGHGTTTGIDLATQPRSTGSTLKPFIYAAAFDAGVCHADSMLLDSPQAWPGYAPNNYDHQFRGTLTAADALAQSRNIPAMVLLAKVSLGRAIGVMEGFGLRTLAHRPRSYGLPLAIGGADATPLELAGAYATMARGGVQRDPSLIGQPRTCPPAEAPALLQASACWETLAALSSPQRTASVCLEAACLKPAWKTGTSSGHRDAWCAAVTPRRTVVVWLGNPAGQGAACLIGQDAAAPLALRLLAALDPGGPTWPAASDKAAHAPCPSLATAANADVGMILISPARTPALTASVPLVMVCPASGQEFIYSPDMPAHSQRIALRAAGGGVPGAAPSDFWWFIDGQSLGRAPAAGPFWWPPAPGSHTVRAVDAAGHWAAASFTVRRPDR